MVGEKINRKWPLALVLLKRLAFPGGFIKTRGTLSFKGHQKCNQPTLVRLYFNFVAHRKSVRALMCK